MRFNAILLALAATTQLTTAAPKAEALVVPKAVPMDLAVRTDSSTAWNGKNAEAGYKAGAVVCGLGSFICNKVGYTVAADTLQSGAYCCGAAAAAVTASQASGWVAAWQAAANALGTAAKVIGGAPAAGYNLVASCTSTVCQFVKQAVGSRDVLTIDGRGANDYPDYTKEKGYEIVVPKSLDDDAILVSRLAFPESDDIIDFD